MSERDDELEDPITVEGSLYLLTANAECWKCRQPQEVIAIAAQGLSEGGTPIPDTQDPTCLVVLSSIVEMPSELLASLDKKHPRYKKQYSRTAEISYYANTCQCGTFFGDHYLVSEPGGAFFPESSVEAAGITLTPLPRGSPQTLRCGYSWGSAGELIWQFARRNVD
jgi:hypothetical protein